MSLDLQISELKTCLSEKRVTYENLKLAALKAWDSQDWATMVSTGESLRYLDTLIESKLLKIQALEQEIEREKIEAIS